jgi:hypothetical protein
MQHVTNPVSLLSLYPSISQSALRQVHSLYQSQFSTLRSSASSSSFQYPLVSLTTFGSCLLLLPRLPVTYILSLYLSLNNIFQKAVPMQDVTNPFSLPSFRCNMQDIPFLLASPQYFFVQHKTYCHLTLKVGVLIATTAPWSAK